MIIAISETVSIEFCGRVGKSPRLARYIEFLSENRQPSISILRCPNVFYPEKETALSPVSGAGTRQAAEGGGVEGGQPGWLRGDNSAGGTLRQ